MAERSFLPVIYRHSASEGFMSFFETGKEYKVLQSFYFGKSTFTKGEKLIYQSGGFSRYDDCYLYEFDDKNGNRKVCRLAPDSDEKEILRYFKKE